MKLFLKVLLLTAAVLVILKSCTPFLGTHNPLVGQPAPDFTLPTLSGEEINMSEFRGQRPAMIFFWATWCPHCRTQLKELSKHRNQFEDNGIAIILVDIREKYQKVKRYMEANDIPFDVFLDETSQLAQDYHIVGVPTFFMVNREGIIISVKNFLPKDLQKMLLGFAS